MTRLFTILVALTLHASFAYANTEIRIFQVDPVSQHANSRGEASLAQLLSLHASLRTDVHRLNASNNEHSFHVRPAPLGTPLQLVCEPSPSGESARRTTVLEEGGCPHELWLQLDLGSAEWMLYDKFTLRLSWPAFCPADFDISLFSLDELHEHIRSRLQSHKDETSDEFEASSPFNSSAFPRVTYARIRLVDTGVRPPLKPTSRLPSLYQGIRASEAAEAVPFTIILEPLLFGVLPVTVVPTILFSIPLLVVVGFAYPHVMRYLGDVAAKARMELYGSNKPKQE